MSIKENDQARTMFPFRLQKLKQKRLMKNNKTNNNSKNGKPVNGTQNNTITNICLMKNIKVVNSLYQL